MSFKLVAEVFDIKVGNPLRKMVLIKLADQANDEGACWPSYESIARGCEIGRRSVITHIKWLEKHNFLWIEKRYNKEQQKNYSNIYHLTLSKGKLPSAADAPVGESDPSAADAPPSAADAPPSSAADAPPSATDAPKPINEPTTKPINETISEVESEKTEDKPLNAKEKRKLLANDLFEKWKELSGQNLRAPESRVKHLNARLSEGFTAEQIIEAMTYVATDRWHVENGHNTIEIAVRSTAQLEAKLIKAAAVKVKATNAQGTNSHDNNQSNSSTRKPNHFDQLRAERDAKYGNRNHGERTVSAEPRLGDQPF